MIENKKDLIYYIHQDRQMNGYPKTRCPGEIIKNLIFPNAVSYLRNLRKVEYFTNVPILGGRFFRAYYNLKLRVSARKLGYYIGINSCGPGLSLPHYGTVIISAEARLGENCRVHVCVNIGRSAGGKKAPQIGDNVYIGPSCVLYGDIIIANNITIGANATVNKSFYQENVVIAGTPAKIVKTDYPNWIELIYRQ